MSLWSDRASAKSSGGRGAEGCPEVYSYETVAIGTWEATKGFDFHNPPFLASGH